MYKWKPNKAQKAEYIAKMEAKKNLPLFTTSKAIRKGCKVTYFSESHGKVLSGEVINSSYGAETGQHTFTVLTEIGKVCVKGRNLYPNMLEHTQGELSLIESK